MYAGKTRCTRQVLETGGSGANLPVGVTSYIQLGIDTVACGDATLRAFLTNQAQVVWGMQIRRGVALDLQYQYYVLDLIELAMAHTRMLIDQETGDSAMSDAANMDASSTMTANSSSSKSRSSSFTEATESAQSWSRTAARSSSASSRLQSSNSASRTGSSSDYSTVSQSSSGSSSRSQTGYTNAMGSLANPNTGAFDGTSGISNSNSLGSTISRTTYEGAGQLGPEVDKSSDYLNFSGNLLGVVSASWAIGTGSVYHQVTPSVLGRINAGGTIDAEGAEGDYSLQNTSTTRHGRTLVGLQTGAGSSTLSGSGTRTNNRTGSTAASSSSSLTGNSSSSMSSSSHEEQTRTASSSSHSESAYASTMTATSSSHREMAATDAMTASGNVDREYYSQIFDSLQQMWDDTQELLRDLEKDMLITFRYLVEPLTVKTPQARLVRVPALLTDRTLIQRPGIRDGARFNPGDPWTIR